MPKLASPDTRVVSARAPIGSANETLKIVKTPNKPQGWKKWKRRLSRVFQGKTKIKGPAKAALPAAHHQSLNGEDDGGTDESPVASEKESDPSPRRSHAPNDRWRSGCVSFRVDGLEDDDAVAVDHSDESEYGGEYGHQHSRSEDEAQRGGDEADEDGEEVELEDEDRGNSGNLSIAQQPQAALEHDVECEEQEEEQNEDEKVRKRVDPVYSSGKHLDDSVGEESDHEQDDGHETSVGSQLAFSEAAESDSPFDESIDRAEEEELEADDDYDAETNDQAGKGRGKVSVDEPEDCHADGLTERSSPKSSGYPESADDVEINDYCTAPVLVCELTVEPPAAELSALIALIPLHLPLVREVSTWCVRHTATTTETRLFVRSIECRKWKLAELLADKLHRDHTRHAESAYGDQVVAAILAQCAA